MIAGQTAAVADADAGERLDRYVLGLAPASARSLVLDAISQGEILLNGRRAAKGAKVAPGDTVTIVRLPERSDLRARPDPSVNLSVVHEDAALLILDKPGGTPVHPLRLDETGTLASGLIARYPDLADIGGDPLFPAIVHRLDADTSGLLVAAKTDPAYAFLREEFRRQRVIKKYIALVHGIVREGARLEHRLAHDPSRPGHMILADLYRGRARLRAMNAVTELEPVRAFAAHTLLDVTIPTGVTHQIRCQLAAAGHPLVDDRLYGGATGDNPGLSRHFLHASELEFTHPLSNQRVHFRSALPQDLASVLKRLEAGPT